MTFENNRRKAKPSDLTSAAAQHGALSIRWTMLSLAHVSLRGRTVQLEESLPPYGREDISSILLFSLSFFLQHNLSAQDARTRRGTFMMLLL